MRMTFTVTYDDGRVLEAVAKPKDIVAFERTYNQSIAAFAAEGAAPPPMEWLYFLAWSPLHRSGREPRAFDEFLSDVENIDPVEDTEGPVIPFPPAASVEPSPV